MNPVVLPKSYNYVGVFLTYACNYKCEWCINKAGELKHCQMLSGRDWCDGLNRLETGDVPLTIGGGEPTLHPEFFDIINSINKPMDLLTNGNWNTQIFIKRVSPLKFRSNAPYAGIRFSYHPGVTPLFKLLKKVLILQREGYSVGIWGVNHPAYEEDVAFAQRMAVRSGIDFRLKEFLGDYKGVRYGTYQYPEMLSVKSKEYYCKPTEMLVGPDGAVYGCHQHLYSGSNSYGNITDSSISIPDDYRICRTKEPCSYCDIKGPKLDRYQKPGHCSVSIKEAM